MQNLYEVLGVHPGASPDEVKSAFRRRAREAHPDACGDGKRFIAIKAAYAVLADPARRAQYDEERRVWMKQVGAVGCPSCGHANRITQRPAERHVVRCWSCKKALRVPPNDLRSAQQQSLVNEAARIVEDLGADLAGLAADAVHAGVARLWQRFGLSRKEKFKS